MPSPLVNRYVVFFRLAEGDRVQEPIGRESSLLVAVECCVAAYRATGHLDYVIEDQRGGREFLVDRDLFLRLVFLKRNDQDRYFEILNRLDRGGSQDELVGFLNAHARV